MTLRKRSLSAHTFSFRQSASRMVFAVLVVFVGLATKTAVALSTGASSAKPCTFSDAEFNPATHARAIENFKDAIAQQLKEHNFAELECIADAARAGKTRFSGGPWKVHQIYQALETPRPGHPTEEDWHEHMQLMQQWRDKYPQSMTARIALAKAYIGYAWDARGDQKADTVSENGWKLFAQRLELAKAILDEAATTPGKDPEWYYEMQQISIGQSWDDAKSADLFKQAIAFEPQYYYYLEMRAQYLQPKWYGESGDTERFAKGVADKVGGDDGDILYFQAAAGIICGCNEPDVNDFSWNRLQKGYTAIEKKYGASLNNTNLAALMATKAQEWEAAEPMFKRIGDNWDENVWITEEWFKQNRDLSTQLAPMKAKARAFHKDAEDNLKSPAGQAYEAQVESKLTPFEQECVSPENSASPKFQLFIEVGKDGSVTEAHVEEKPSPMAWCIMKGLYASFVKKETPFPAPSKAPYAMMVEIDPAVLKTASK